MAPIALINIFVLVAGLVTRDIIVSLPPDPSPRPVAHAEAAGEDAESTGISDSGALAQLLDNRISESGAAEGLSAYVVDAATGEELYSRDSGDPLVPASTTKIATAVAALHAIGPEEHIQTTVARGAEPDEVVLVGGGDPTLTESQSPGSYPRLATLEDLAQDTAAALAEEGVDSVRVGYDDSHYAGPDTAPGWRPNYVTEGSVATVHALMLDGGRVDPDLHYGPREADPPSAAAAAFAEQLRQAGVDVSGEPGELAADADHELALAESPSIAVLVETMMRDSENNIAEALAHQVAVAQGGEASFSGGSAAVQDALAGLDVSDIHVEDGSGLSVDNEMTAQALVDILLLAGEPQRPELRYTLTGLPVAHFSGTLSGRYTPGSGASDGAGWVRAKTGTLNGVSTLAGMASDPDGRLLVFAFMANNPMAQGSALDQLASALAECRC